MFEMKIEKQMNLRDRTLLAGIPQYDIIPKRVRTGGQEFAVVGISRGVKAPYMSLEIEKTNVNLEGQIIKD